jgi:N-acetylmuramoyl-L-alanine amidase
MSITAPRRALVVALILSATLLGSAGTALAFAPAPAPLIVIDPGHGGRYSNANSNGLKEKNVNLQIALALASELATRGYEVTMTRTTDRALELGNIPTWNYSSRAETWAYRKDWRNGYSRGVPFDDLQARVNFANRLGADLFISVHGNAAARRSARGTETYATYRDKLGRQLAPIVNQEIIKATGLPGHGGRSADFYVLRWSNMPAILVESAFISNSTDAALLKRPEFRSRIASGIAQGVDQWMATSPYRPVYPRVSASSPAALAAAVSASDFPTGALVAVIGRSDLAMDAPGLPGLAVALGGPLLWAEPSGIGTATAAELTRLRPKRLVVAGVSGSFDDAALGSLAAAAGVPVSAIELLGGQDRHALSGAIARQLNPSASGEVIVTTSAGRAALVAAPISAAKGVPLLIVDNGAVGPEAVSYLTENRFWIRRIVLVGGVSPLPESIVSTRTSVSRVDGNDTAQRASALNRRYFTSQKAGATRPVVASYLSAADYLSAAARAGRIRQPLIPVAGRALPAYTRDWITNRRDAIGSFTVMDGGTVPLLMDAMLAKADHQ